MTHFDETFCRACGQTYPNCTCSGREAAFRQGAQLGKVEAQQQIEQAERERDAALAQAAAVQEECAKVCDARASLFTSAVLKADFPINEILEAKAKALVEAAGLIRSLAIAPEAGRKLAEDARKFRESQIGRRDPGAPSETDERVTDAFLAQISPDGDCRVDIVDAYRMARELLALRAQLAQVDPVATVRVGGADHGPFIFNETPYGADTLTDGIHFLYVDLPKSSQAEPVAWRCKLTAGGAWRYWDHDPLLDNNCPFDSIEPLYAHPLSGYDRLAQGQPSDEEILSRIINECDTLDITRVSELKKGEWHATTIFDGDTALLRTFKSAMLPAAPESEGKP